jgi:hypothetical protein
MIMRRDLSWKSGTQEGKSVVAPSFVRRLVPRLNGAAAPQRGVPTMNRIAGVCDAPAAAG